MLCWMIASILVMMMILGSSLLLGDIRWWGVNAVGNWDLIREVRVICLWSSIHWHWWWLLIHHWAIVLNLTVGADNSGGLLDVGGCQRVWLLVCY